MSAPTDTMKETSVNILPFPGRSRMSDELIAALRQRVEERYYDQPKVLEIIAQAILHSRGLYL